MTERKQLRPEAEVFSELEALCSAPGYIHAIAYFCHRDNMILYSGEMKPEDMRHLFSRDRLIRTEITTLIGLMCKHEISYEIPSSDVMQSYIDKTEKLLLELHWSISSAFFAGFDPKSLKEEKLNAFTTGAALREPIFYGGESSYSFQYRDLAVRKYCKDDEWLKAHKGFSVEMARDVVQAVGWLGDEKSVPTINAMMKLPPDQWTIFPASEFSAREVADRSGKDQTVVERVLSAFVLPEGDRNAGFTALNEFNVVNASPLIRRGDSFVLLQIYSLVEALYDAPFYWMGADKGYVNAAMRNRGLFTEEFSVERLALVFGKERVYANVDIIESKEKRIGEIDALVIFGNRAVVLQAKSKRLTLEARKGNDGQIKNDFKKSVQDAYDQGLACAKLLLDRRYAFIDGQGNNVVVPALKEVYILCVVSDHYPALGFQARQFLETETTGNIPPPFVLDVFTLDAMTEMLDTPLLLLSYIDRRVKYSDKLMASHELTILSFHIKYNLWLSDKYDFVALEDDISTDLDLAMTARREGIPAKRMPDGFLTRLRHTAVGRFIQQIESRPDGKTIDLGFMLLTIDGEAVDDITRGVNKLAAMAQADGKNHDITIGFGSGTGLTVHCNDDPFGEAVPRLEAHCHLRKYSQQARTWFGVCARPSDMSLRFGINLDFPWERNYEMDAAVKRMPEPRGLAELVGSGSVRGRRSTKPGRNEPCVCGSGKKYKKCCGVGAR